MKKVLFLLLASFLVLAAYGQEESKSEDKKQTKSSDKESKKDDNKKESVKKEDQSDDKSNEEVATQDENAEQMNTQEKQTTEQLLQSQEQVNNQEQQTAQAAVQSQEQATIEQEPQKEKIDLNQFPGGDFSTEDMSENAQKQIEELSRQKDYEGLPQKEYNDQVSEIMNNEIN